MTKCYGCFSHIEEGGNVCPYCGFPTRITEYPKWVLRPGTILNGKYEIGKSLGEGGFGITYLAWDINMETKVAIKEYFPSSLVSRDVTSISGNSISSTTSGPYESFEVGMKRYVKEAATLSKFFNLPGIVSVKDFFYENNTAYIVMEYIDGMSLKAYLKQHGERVSFNEAIALIQPVISSLSIIHSNKLLHRDISPDNIMIQYDGQIKLIDFGAARSIDNQADNGMTVMLKHGYAPIEQYSRNGAQGEYTDVYGICAVLYRMITGMMPVEATDRVSKDTLVPIRKIVKDVPRHIAAAIEKGLSVTPENRQQSMQELYENLYISNKGLVDKKLDSLYKGVRRVLLVMVFLLVLLTVVGIYYRINYDDFENVREAWSTLRGEKTDTYYEQDDGEEVKTKEKKDKSDDIAKERSDKNDKANLDESKAASEDEAIDATEEVDELEKIANDALDNTAYDDEINAAIEAVRFGTISGDSNRTVESILNNYSFTIGTWDGTRDSNGEIFVIYTGNRSNEEFNLIFHITSRTVSATEISIGFELSGAIINDEAIPNYREFFNEIISY